MEKPRMTVSTLEYLSFFSQIAALGNLPKAAPVIGDVLGRLHQEPSHLFLPPLNQANDGVRLIVRSGDSKRAEFSVELLVNNVQPTVQKLSGAV
jgi:hypothetical protein